MEPPSWEPRDREWEPGDRAWDPRIGIGSEGQGIGSEGQGKGTVRGDGVGRGESVLRRRAKGEGMSGAGACHGRERASPLWSIEGGRGGTSFEVAVIVHGVQIRHEALLHALEVGQTRAIIDRVLVAVKARQRGVKGIVGMGFRGGAWKGKG